MTIGGHLETLRRMLIRICAVLVIFAVIIFCFKDFTFNILLAPSESDFSTYRVLERTIQLFSSSFHFEPFHVDMISTNLSSQFITHVSTSVYLGLLCTSPLILFELFRFITPALLTEERKYSVQITATVYILFIFGVLMSYFILFPISFRFLGTYSVAEKVHSTITLDSYISTFVTLTLMMGLVFQLPVIAYILARLGFISSNLLAKNRKYALLIICTLAAIITPPDIMTLIVVAIPLYLLYEVSINVIRRVERKQFMVESDLTKKK